MSGWRAVVLKLVRIPHDPDPPPGSPPRVFRAARNYFYFRLLLWWIGNVAFVVGVIAFDFGLVQAMADSPGALVFVVRSIAVLGVIVILLRLTLGYAVMRLDYELRWYMISDRAIRIREGIISVREKTMSLANIQNTVVKQGPLQRLFGIADVQVTTAGGGGSAGQEHGKKDPLSDPMHVAFFRGVDNAREIRDIIQEGVRRHRHSGLGDPDDEATHDPAVLLLEEVRLTRRMLESGMAGP